MINYASENSSRWCTQTLCGLLFCIVHVFYYWWNSSHLTDYLSTVTGAGWRRIKWRTINPYMFNPLFKGSDSGSRGLDSISTHVMTIVPDRMHFHHHTALSEISNRIVGKILLRIIWYHTLFFFQCGVYKYCCSVCGTFWCEDEVRSANCVRTMMSWLLKWQERMYTRVERVLGYSDSGRCQTSPRYCRATRVLGIYNDRRKLCCKVVCGDYFKAYLMSIIITVTMSTYLQYLGPTYFIEYARTYVFVHDFTYEIHEKRTGWQPCSMSQRRGSL